MKWEVIAYADRERKLERKRDFVWADTKEEAERKARGMFPEYHEIAVYKV
jgi:hypothetical protein